MLETSVPTYVELAQAEVAKALHETGHDCPPELVALYALLALVRGVDVTLEDVHDAWAVWRQSTKPEHRSIVPFAQLSPEVQALDEPYREAIVTAAARRYDALWGDTLRDLAAA